MGEISIRLELNHFIDVCKPSSRCAMAVDLPPEVWLQIFDYASEDDALFDHALPTSLAESSWFRTVFNDGQWMLKSPNEGINGLQRRSYATKKVRPDFSTMNRM